MKSTNVIASFQGIIILFALVAIPILALWTERSLEFWLSYFKGVEVDVPYWLCLLVTLFPPTFVVNILSEIIRLAV